MKTFEAWYNESEWRACDNAVLVADDAWDYQQDQIDKLKIALQDLANLKEDIWCLLKKSESKVEQLKGQLNLDGITNSQRCDRCHFANFFNGDEFKCWNCGLEHTEE